MSVCIGVLTLQDFARANILPFYSCFWHPLLIIIITKQHMYSSKQHAFGTKKHSIVLNSLPFLLNYVHIVLKSIDMVLNSIHIVLKSLHMVLNNIHVVLNSKRMVLRSIHIVRNSIHMVLCSIYMVLSSIHIVINCLHISSVKVCKWGKEGISHFRPRLATVVPLKITDTSRKILYFRFFPAMEAQQYVTDNYLIY